MTADTAPMLDAEPLQALFDLAKRLTPSVRLTLVKRARRSVQAVTKDAERSELADLVQDDPAIGPQWLQSTSELAARLKHIADGLGKPPAATPKA